MCIVCLSRSTISEALQRLEHRQVVGVERSACCQASRARFLLPSRSCSEPFIDRMCSSSGYCRSSSTSSTSASSYCRVRYRSFTLRQRQQVARLRRRRLVGRRRRPCAGRAGGLRRLAVCFVVFVRGRSLAAAPASARVCLRGASSGVAARRVAAASRSAMISRSAAVIDAMSARMRRRLAAQRHLDLVRGRDLGQLDLPVALAVGHLARRSGVRGGSPPAVYGDPRSSSGGTRTSAGTGARQRAAGPPRSGTPGSKVLSHRFHQFIAGAQAEADAAEIVAGELRREHVHEPSLQ